MSLETFKLKFKEDMQNFEIMKEKVYTYFREIKDHQVCECSISYPPATRDWTSDPSTVILTIGGANVFNNKKIEIPLEVIRELSKNTLQDILEKMIKAHLRKENGER